MHLPGQEKLELKATGARGPLRVFVSKPGTSSQSQAALVRELESLFADEGVELTTVDRPEYPPVGAIPEVRRVSADVRAPCVWAAIDEVGARHQQL